MLIAMLQCNLTVGDLEGNASRLLEAAKRASMAGARLCVATELAITGYPPRDLLLNSSFLDAAWDQVHTLAREMADLPPCLVGVPEPNPSQWGKPAYNSAALLRRGKVEQTFRKRLLPTYDVFDEHRYFAAGECAGVFDLDGFRVGVTICEDVWNDTDFWAPRPMYDNDPVDDLMQAGAQVIVNLSASPFSLGKQKVREAMLAQLAKKRRTPVIYVNQAGGNDDLVFDGRSMGFNADGVLFARAAAFNEEVKLADLDGCHAASHGVWEDASSTEENAWRALVLGVRDYVRKCGFSRGVIGLSGGVDSSLSAAIAAEALGPRNVLCVMMPSPFSSESSITDSEKLVENLGVKSLTLPIESIMQAYDDVLSKPFALYDKDVTEENIQARIRGVLLMALSNKFRAMVLTTGNKSELSVGYCTIYGDMAGAMSVIGDAPKGLVYGVCRWLNAKRGEAIPENVLTKPPSAELRPDQTDQDSLPPYDILDAILERMVELRQPVDAIVEAGFDRATVVQVCKLVRAAEFKRKQAPPCVKITDRAFGTGWRMPVAARIAC